MLTAGHRPQSTYVMHDALYRVISASFSYTQEDGRRTTADDPTDWRESQARIRGDYPAEGAGPNADPMLVEPAPMLQDPDDVPGRVIDLEWQWDWLGNTTRWDDDAHLFYERSIGAIANGVDRPASESLRPSALYIATNLPATGMLSSEQQERAGWAELSYGDGGNVTEMTVHAQCHDRAPSACTDLPSASPSDRAAHLRSHCECDHEQHYQYRWDELNRLAEARRWDRDVASAQSTWTLQVRQRYRYDGANVRMIKATIEPSVEADAGTPSAHDERIALYVYPGDFEVRGLERAVGSNQYIAGLGLRDRVETHYVVAGARLVWRNVTGGELDQARHRRLTLPLTDIIQTTAATLDLLDGDLVEASTYYPNGARETLLSDDTDPSTTEASGFTGKEADEEVGVTYFGERYLVARIGRWASPDPLHLHQAGGGEALNAYHYVGGVLVQARDPVGLTVQVEGTQISDPNGRGTTHTVTDDQARRAAQNDILDSLPEAERDLFEMRASGEIVERDRATTDARAGALSERSAALRDMIRAEERFVIHPLVIEDGGRIPPWIGRAVTTTTQEGPSLRVSSSSDGGETYDVPIYLGSAAQLRASAGLASAGGVTYVSPELHARAVAICDANPSACEIAPALRDPAQASSRISHETHSFYVTGVRTDRGDARLVAAQRDPITGRAPTPHAIIGLRALRGTHEVLGHGWEALRRGPYWHEGGSYSEHIVEPRIRRLQEDARTRAVERARAGAGGRE